MWPLTSQSEHLPPAFSSTSRPVVNWWYSSHVHSRTRSSRVYKVLLLELTLHNTRARLHILLHTRARSINTWHLLPPFTRVAVNDNNSRNIKHTHRVTYYKYLSCLLWTRIIQKTYYLRAPTAVKFSFESHRAPNVFFLCVSLGGLPRFSSFY